MTVDQWLGKSNQLGIDIWKGKYQHGNETFDEWLDRVSAGNEDLRKLIIEKKFLFGGRILANRGLQKYGRKITYSNCFSGDTKILTKAGIKQLKDIVGINGIKVLSNGGWHDASVKSFGVQPIKELTISRNGVKKKIFVTGDHIWFASKKRNGIFKQIVTNNLEPGMFLMRDLMKCYRTYKPSPFGVAHGFFSGDGDHTGSCRRVSFCGDKKELLQYFMPDVVGQSGNINTIYCIPKAFWTYPELDETPSYLYGWLAGYFAADGSIDERGSCVICSSKKSDLEFVRNVLCVLGIPSEEIRSQTRLSNLTNRVDDIYILGLNKHYLNENFFILSKHRKRFNQKFPVKDPALWRVEDVSDIVREEEVFCAVVPDTSSFTLDGNILTHNCYVVTPPSDNIESIFECASKLARTFSYGGGCGVDISNLAPRGAKVNNTAKQTSGAVSFMDLYSTVTGLIGQNGRRGALMLSIDCSHPDLEEFIEVKSDLDRVTKANISIRISDEFMKAVKADWEYKLNFTREATKEVIRKTVKAKDLFHKIAKMNWDYAEPGMLFWDTISNYNLLSNTKEFSYAGTNPCAEEPLPAGGSCLLGSINLAEFVHGKQFDFHSFYNTVDIAVKALNDVLDEGMELHPLQEQRDSVWKWRQIGLGVMGIADMLIKMEIPYGSESSINLCEQIAKGMANRAIMTSSELAKEFGNFPGCGIEDFNIKEVVSTSFFKENTDKITQDNVLKYGLCNSQLLTIAPTGTLSSMLGISGGIEPIFANYYTRKTESLHGEDVYYKVYTPIVDKYMKEHRIVDDKDLPDWFVTAQTLNYRDRIKMQAIWQKHIDASISSTVNVPNDFSVDDVEALYMLAWESGLKGVTIFRDGCKRAGILTLDESKLKSNNELKRGDIIQVNDDVVGKKRKLMTGCGSLHCTAFFDPVTGDLLETYLSKGSTGGCNNFMIGLSRMISLSARSGCDIQTIVDQLNSCGVCPSYAVRTATKHDTSKGSCCPITVGNALLDMWQEMQEEIGLTEEIPLIDSIKSPCPECGEELVFEGGCNICKSCGWSKCS